MFDGVLWRLNTGAPWRDLPGRFGPWQTVYDRYSAMRAGGLLDRIIARLQLRLNEAGLIDPRPVLHRRHQRPRGPAAGGAAKKKSAAR